MIKLKKYRLMNELGFQDDFAKLLGVTRATINGYEANARPLSLKTALRYAKILGCSVDDIYSPNEEREFYIKNPDKAIDGRAKA